MYSRLELERSDSCDATRFGPLPPPAPPPRRSDSWDECPDVWGRGPERDSCVNEKVLGTFVFSRAQSFARYWSLWIKCAAWFSEGETNTRGDALLMCQQRTMSGTALFVHNHVCKIVHVQGRVCVCVCVYVRVGAFSRPAPECWLMLTLCVCVCVCVASSLACLKVPEANSSWQDTFIRE